MTKKVGGCVILYNPEDKVLNNIAAFKTHIDFFLVVDNSPEQNLQFVSDLKNLHSEVRYTWMGENRGIAYALNIACQMAILENCMWLLTMDQDSSFKRSELSNFLLSIDEVTNIFDSAGIICPYHNIHDWFSLGGDNHFQEIRSTMTSGNLINLQVYQKVGGFKEDLFIDYVDHDYCLRIRKRGFKIIQNNKILLEHSLGHFELKRFLWKRFGVSNHNHIRRYYITRNGLYTAASYFFFDPRFCIKILQNLTYDLVRVLFFEKNKFLKFKAMIIGFWHWMINRFGQYDLKK
jgi:rhamnosyltransferase